MLGRLQGLQEEGQPAERGGPMPGYQSGTEQRMGAPRSCHIRRMPDPEISQIRITNSAWSFYLVTEYLPPLITGWPYSCKLMEIMIR